MTNASNTNAPVGKVVPLHPTVHKGAEMPDDDRFGDAPEPEAETTTRRVWTPDAVIATWVAEGPLVHLSTGFPRLDDLTGGGPVAGSRWYLSGAPDAGKTAVLVQMLDDWAKRGMLVGLLAVDEEPSDIVTRLVQRAGWHRRECEEREPLMLEEMARRVTAGWRLYDEAWTIEDAAADLAAEAKKAGKRAAMGIDSIQTVRCLAEKADGSERETVTARVRAVRASATMHRMWIGATSEMNRGAYRAVDAAERSDDMASAKESGAIEYSARVMLALRSVKGEGEIIDVHVVKNKHGPSREHVFLGIDRKRQTIFQTDEPEKAEPAAKGEGLSKVAENAGAIVQILVHKPGLGTNSLRAEVRASGATMSNPAVDAALVYAIKEGLLEDRPTLRGKLSDHHYFALGAPASDGRS